MDWKTIAPIVGAIAPMAGSIIGGLIPFPGGSIIGEKLGKIIAAQLGVAPTPEAVNEKIATSTEETKRAAITAAVDKARLEIEGFVAYERAVLEAQVKNLTDVNATIRADIDNRVKLLLAGIKEHWFFSGWRPAFAWVFIAVYALFGVALSVVTGVEIWRSPTPLKTMQDAWPLFLAYFGPGAAMLGVLIPSRSAEKVASMQASAPMPNAKPQPVPPLPKVVPAEPPRIPTSPVKPPPGGRIPEPLGSRT